MGIRMIFLAVAAASFSAGSFGEESRSEVCTWTEFRAITAAWFVGRIGSCARFGATALRTETTGGELDLREPAAFAVVGDATAVLMNDAG